MHLLTKELQIICLSLQNKVFNIAHLLYKIHSFNRKKAQPEMCFSAWLSGSLRSVYIRFRKRGETAAHGPYAAKSRELEAPSRLAEQVNRHPWGSKWGRAQHPQGEAAALPLQPVPRDPTQNPALAVPTIRSPEGKDGLKSSTSPFEGVPDHWPTATSLCCQHMTCHFDVK